MVTKSELYGSNPSAVLDAGNAVRDGDSVCTTELDSMVAGVRALGESWNGEAFDAAYQRVSDDHASGARLSDDILDLAEAIINAAHELSGWRDAALAKVASAEEDGCVVNDDWVVEHSDSGIAEGHGDAVAGAVADYSSAAASCAAKIEDMAARVRATGDTVDSGTAAAPDGAVGSLAGAVSTSEGPTDLLPGTPVPSTDGVETRDPFGTTRIVPGQTFPAGFSDPNLTSPLAERFGRPIPIDPETTRGAVGGYSGNILTPNPMTNTAGIGLPGLDAGKAVPGGASTRTPASLDIDAVKGAQIRIVSAEPYAMSTADYGGKPELAVHYRYNYQVQYTYTALGSAIVQSTDWSDLTLEEVQHLAKQGVPVPRLD